MTTPDTTESPRYVIASWAHVPSHLRFWIPAVALLALDLWSKQAVFATLDAESAVPILGNLVELRKSLNDGAVFGSFTGYVGVFIVAYPCKFNQTAAGRPIMGGWPILDLHPTDNSPVYRL